MLVASQYDVVEVVQRPLLLSDGQINGPDRNKRAVNSDMNTYDEVCAATMLNQSRNSGVYTPILKIGRAEYTDVGAC